MTSSIFSIEKNLQPAPPPLSIESNKPSIFLIAALFTIIFNFIVAQQ